MTRTSKRVGAFVAVGACAVLVASGCGGTYEVEPSVCDGRAKDACLDGYPGCYPYGPEYLTFERCVPPCGADGTCGAGRVPTERAYGEYELSGGLVDTHDNPSLVCVCVPESDFGRP